MNRVFIFLLTTLLFCTSTVSAQDIDIENLRGSWTTEINGERHVLYIVYRDETVSGIYCHDCEQPANLAIIDDAVIDEDGFHFALYHRPSSPGNNSNASPYLEWADAFMDGDELNLYIRRAGNSARRMIFKRPDVDMRGMLTMPPFATNMPATGGDRVLPGEPMEITPEKVEGLWLWAVGPGKQHFIFKQHKGGLRGMVCGPCDSPADVTPVENISINGTNLHFEIRHENNGAAVGRYGPNSNIVDAEISNNELHMSVVPSYAEPGSTPVEMTLLGPIYR